MTRIFKILAAIVAALSLLVCGYLQALLYADHYLVVRRIDADQYPVHQEISRHTWALTLLVVALVIIITAAMVAFRLITGRNPLRLVLSQTAPLPK